MIDIVLRVNNVSKEDLAMLMAAEKMGLTFDGVIILNQGNQTPCQDVHSAASLIAKVFSTINNMFR